MSHRKRIILLALVLLTSVLVGCAAHRVPTDAKTLAMQVVDKIASGNCDEAVGSFDAKMKTDVSAGTLSEEWQQITKAYGAYKGETFVRTRKKQKYDIVLIDCRFAQGSAYIVVAVDPQKQVAGFNIYAKH